MAHNFREVEVADMTAVIVKFLAERPEDIEVKAAALTAASTVLTQAVLAQSLAATVANIIRGPK